LVGESEGPRSSGRLPSHYAPRAALEIVAAARLDEACRAARRKGERVAALTLSRACGDADLSVVMPERPVAYARRLYAELRRVDDAGCDRIVVERPPDEDAWAAIRDRLRRAAA
jgi:L-threonylcarbamoyladenylate synthase